jgi:hypothetical protein
VSLVAGVAPGGVRVAVVVDPTDGRWSPLAAVALAERQLGDEVTAVARPKGELVATVHLPADAIAPDALVITDPATGGPLPTTRPAGAEQRARQLAQMSAYRAANRTEVPLLAADVARGRLLYVVQGTQQDPAADGLWAFDAKTGQRQRVLPLPLRSMMGIGDGSTPSTVLSWADAADDGTVLLSTNLGLIAFDPRTDTARTLYQQVATPPVLPAPTTRPGGAANDMLSGRLALFPPFAFGDGWVWSALVPLARASVDGRVYQQFPSLRPAADGQPRMMSTVRLFAGNRHLLVADHAGCWVLDPSR